MSDKAKATTSLFVCNDKLVIAQVLGGPVDDVVWAVLECGLDKGVVLCNGWWIAFESQLWRYSSQILVEGLSEIIKITFTVSRLDNWTLLTSTEQRLVTCELKQRNVKRIKITRN